MGELAISDEPCGAFLFNRDVELARRIIDGAAIGMAVAGMDGRIVYANRALRRDFWTAAGAGEELTLRDIILPECTEGLQAVENALSARSAGSEGEFLLRGVDGRAVWARVALSTLDSNSTGQPVYVIAQFASIAQRKQAEAALTESESRWNFALAAARQGVWDHDARTGRVYYSAVWRAIRGIPEDEPVDDRQEVWLQRLHPEDRERIRETVGRQNLGEDGYDTLQYRERHRDGHYIWILSRGKPVEWDADGKVVRTIGTDTDISELKAIEAQLAHAATHDPLTGLANRAACREAVVQSTSSQPGCLLFIDLDHFKPVNDGLGHSAGDALLIKVAERIRGTVRHTDLVARVGGDEFVVLLRNCDLETGEEIANAIAMSVQEISVRIADKPHRLGASIGLVQLDRGTDADTIFVKADEACYAAKRAGRSRVVTYPSLPEAGPSAAGARSTKSRR